ncbi:efflux RND transporter periplasmic adaptor subunit [Undibacterium oligocarboniphilum]|uniref:Efflux RND transporter periplasmic adaptor subunit n=1 Tax=Undibacterium oligocarboniphilum TaxID=666702 RepID=A0A850QD89_9BURK|nr:efflux RND transporter periplasmic adaptor subunit [Undibacterium oligocarboniphilum]MBC3870411.1 efflux RND transporter periplasmic adaptor subunit [Undibacterium oligocarboniphilum]NVO78402.1 efflux RND transporter periplasmic adaptor subunit [Undibacterium oligocarboniphilum]
MNRHYLLAVLAISGLALTVFSVVRDDQVAIPDKASGTEIRSPFANQIAGTGITEAYGGNIAIGTPVAAIIKSIPVRWGSTVSAGTPLVYLDDSDLQARLPLANARMKEAQARLAMSRHASERAERISDKRAISAEEVDNRRFSVKTDEMLVATAQAAVDEIKMEMQRRIVRAPASGQILQIRLHNGEYADNSAPLILMGDSGRRQVRVDIDENDARYVRSDAAAFAYSRNDAEHPVTLHFERIEPYLRPKSTLIGTSAERVDTRVLQVIYSFDTKDMPLYIGQMLDVFIDAGPKPHTASSRRSTAAGAVQP